MLVQHVDVHADSQTSVTVSKRNYSHKQNNLSDRNEEATHVCENNRKKGNQTEYCRWNIYDNLSSAQDLKLSCTYLKIASDSSQSQLKIYEPCHKRPLLCSVIVLKFFMSGYMYL